MSKERARLRAEREHETARSATAREAEVERHRRHQARAAQLTRWLPRRRPRPGGALAERRRRQLGVTVALLLAVNVLVWVVSDLWAARTLALFVSLLAAPVLHTMLFRKN